LNETLNEFYQYENDVDAAKKSSLGIVYTPHWIVDYINREVLKRWRGKQPPKVVDPCCGTGIFLHDMAQKISQRWSMPIKTVFQQYIFGFDVDTEAISIARELLPFAFFRNG